MSILCAPNLHGEGVCSICTSDGAIKENANLLKKLILLGKH
jgi:hypothetical protein